MPRRLLAFVLLTFGVLVGVLGVPAGAQEEGRGRVDVVQIDGVLDRHVARYLRGVIERANEQGSALVAIQLDTPGGLNVDASRLVDPILASDVPVLTFVGDSGARVLGAGVFVAQASDFLMVSPVTQIGAAHPADLRGAAGSPEEGAAMLEELARANGRDPEVARAAAADDEVTVVLAAGAEPGDVDPDAVAGSAARFVTSEEALDGGVADAVVPDLFAAIDAAGFRASSDALRFNNLGLGAEILSTASNPTLAYLLLMAALLCLAFEWFQPGFGVAGISALPLLGLGLYGLWELPVNPLGLVLLLAGTALLALDLAISGLGWPTVAGGGATLAGSLLLFDGPDPLRLPVWVAVLVTLGSLAFFLLVMTWVLRAQGSQAPADAAALVGKRGVVRSVLNPEGHVFVEGALWRARVPEEAGRVRTGTQVRVIGVDDDATLDVELVPQPAPPEPSAPLG